MPYFKIFALFTLAGPLIGGAILVAFLVIVSLAEAQSSSSSWADVVKELPATLLVVAMFSYAFGILQAAATGALAARVAYRQRRLTYRMSALLALAVSLLVGLALDLLVPVTDMPAPPPPSWLQEHAFVILLGFLSIIAALACRYLAGRFKLLPEADVEHA
ncbi:MAG: hypothetical protein ACRCS9_02580 [Hyphomicrobium sp.]